MNFFSVRMNFIFAECASTAVFSQVVVATSENISLGVHECNKIWSNTEKKSIFMLLFTIINLLPAL